MMTKVSLVIKALIQTCSVHGLKQKTTTQKQQKIPNPNQMENKDKPQSRSCMKTREEL